ncbi:Vms1/Ankzf1 family peptidyl-tRNA hydrolase [Microbacterium sp. 179-I 3D4 NHS]|uniref:baeRF2 domain-containing protein n=1 Tax=Microbacterium sp. 179-I 3D4 NHS TaxID=3142381 RepID=UPI00399FC874
MTDAQLIETLHRPGPWTSAYVDGPGPVPQVEEESYRRSVRERLVEAGAPEADAVVVEEALIERTGLPSPSSRVLLVRDGEVVVDRSFAGARLGPECLEHGPLPAVLPLLRHATAERYLVVETSRDGADIRLETAGRGSSEAQSSVEGRTDTLNKAQAGGWAHANFHRHTEDIWKHTQSEVAQAVGALIRDRHPSFVVVSGDIRARQLLGEALSDAERALVVEVDAHTRAEGSDTTELDHAIARTIHEHRTEAIRALRDRAAADGGSGGADGLDAVIDAVQQARVDTLLLDARMLDDDATLLALDGPPWVARDESERLAAEVVGAVGVAEALARAALLTDARVLVEEEEYAADDAPRDERPVRQPLAALRWADAKGDDDEY